MQFISSETVWAIIKIPPDSPAANNFHFLRDIVKKYGEDFWWFLNKIQNINFTQKNMKSTLFLNLINT